MADNTAPTTLAQVIKILDGAQFRTFERALKANGGNAQKALEAIDSPTIKKALEKISGQTSAQAKGKTCPTCGGPTGPDQTA